jgi:hypothetical protein
MYHPRKLPLHPQISFGKGSPFHYLDLLADAKLSDTDYPSDYQANVQKLYLRQLQKSPQDHNVGRMGPLPNKIPALIP